MSRTGPFNMNSSINKTSTMTGVVAVDIAGAPHKAVAFNSDGNLIPAVSGAVAVGVVLSETLDELRAGMRVSFAIKDVVPVEAGGAIARGALVTVNASGQVATAASGDFVFGRAFGTAANAGEIIEVQINQMGQLA